MLVHLLVYLFGSSVKVFGKPCLFLQQILLRFLSLFPCFVQGILLLVCCKPCFILVASLGHIRFPRCILLGIPFTRLYLGHIAVLAKFCLPHAKTCPLLTALHAFFCSLCTVLVGIHHACSLRHHVVALGDAHRCACIPRLA